jgi:hypothetical protein
MPAEVAQLAKQVTADAELEGSNPVQTNTKGLVVAETWWVLEAAKKGFGHEFFPQISKEKKIVQVF